MKSKIRQRVNAIYDETMSVDEIYSNYAKKSNIGYLDMLFFYELLEDDEPYSQKRMCEVLQVSKTTLNSLVKRWIDKEIIELVAVEHKKEKIIHLTKEGEIFAHDLIDPLFKMEEKAVEVISDEDIQTIHQIIQKYKDALVSQM